MKLTLTNNQNKFGSLQRHFQKDDIIELNQLFSRFSILNENPNLITIQVNKEKFLISHQKILDLLDIQIDSITIIQDCDIQITYSVA